MYVFFSLIFFVSCKRVPIEILNQTAEVKNAKEWYYGTFKKSDTYKVSSEAAAQLPDWKYGKHRKSGNLEIIEFPLNKARKSFAISSKGYSINQITDIANGSISRIAFIKTDSKEFILREIDYIPDFEYLKEKEYDISDIELGANIKNFSGYVAIKNWGGSVINTYKYKNGKIIKTKVKVYNSNISLSRRGGYDCQPGEDCMYIRWCETELIGDTWYYTGECTQWENTGECWQTDECDGIPPSDCALYGVDCGGGNGGDGESSSTYSFQSNHAKMCGSYNWGTIRSAWYTQFNSAGFLAVNTNGAMINLEYGTPCIQFSKSTVGTKQQADAA